MQIKKIALIFFLVSLTLFVGCDKELKSIKIEDGDLSIKVGESHQLKVVSDPADVVLSKIFFVSNSPSVVTVLDDGTITGLKAGSAKITAAADGKSHTINVSVTGSSESNLNGNEDDENLFYITAPIKTIGLGQSYKLNLSDNAKVQNHTFISSDKSVINIDETGLMSAKKVGVAYISVVNALGKSASLRISVIDSLPIIPEPQNISILTGEFIIDEHTKVFNNSGIDCSKQIALFKNQIELSSGVAIGEGSSDKNVIRLETTSQNKNSEWYNLKVEQNQIVITAKTKSGFFYGFQTILQMMDAKVYSKKKVNFDLDVPCVNIDDEPRFAHRSLLIDVSRHIFELDTLKTIIDEISKTKMNRFHWHLTDDGGFRFPFEGTVTVGSKVYDLSALIKKTSYRTGNQYANFPQAWNFFDPTDPSDPWYAKKENMHGGCYTKEEILDFISYCDDRGVTIIPEIDMPGHCKPLYMFFEDLRCDKLGGSGVPASVPASKKENNITNDICASSAATLPILKELIRQVAKVFPGEVLHIGADEVHLKTDMWYNLGPWWFCSRCEQKIKEIVGPSAAVNYNNLQKLQAYVVKEIEQAVIANGKICALWNEGVRGGFTPDPSTLLWYWNGIDDLNSGLSKNMKVVNCDQWYFYTALYQHQSDRTEKNPAGQDWGGSAPNVTVEYIYKSYFNKAKNGNNAVALGNNQLGAQICMWGEKLIGFTKNGKTYNREEHLIYMLFPRIYALAERTWTTEDKANYPKFYSKLQTQFKRLDNANIDCYATHYKE